MNMATDNSAPPAPSKRSTKSGLFFENYDTLAVIAVQLLLTLTHSCVLANRGS